MDAEVLVGAPLAGASGVLLVEASRFPLVEASWIPLAEVAVALEVLLRCLPDAGDSPLAEACFEMSRELDPSSSHDEEGQDGDLAACAIVVSFGAWEPSAHAPRGPAFASWVRALGMHECPPHKCPWSTERVFPVLAAARW